MADALLGLWQYLLSPEFRLAVLWTALAAIGISLLVLVTTRWGTSRPLEKCFVLSAAVHVWVALYLTTVTIVTVAPPGRDESVQVSLTLVGDDTETSGAAAKAPAERAEEKSGGEEAEAEKPWDAFGREWSVPEHQLEVARRDAPEPRSADRAVRPAPRAVPPTHPTGGDTPPPDPPQADWLTAHAAVRIHAPAEPAVDVPEAVAPAVRESPEGNRPSPTPAPRVEGDDAAEQATNMRAGETAGAASPSQRTLALPVAGTEVSTDAASAAGTWRGAADSGSAPGSYSMPSTYRLRVAPDRAKQAARRGADARTEAAVAAALGWLAANQEPDGRWSARKHGAGQENMEAGRDRQGAGRNADTGMTGLALLAFAARGSTHRGGEYENVVRRGTEYLLRSQAADGHLAGAAEVYEFMYCHGMAMLALAELTGMTGDESLRTPLSRAVAYTLTAQDPVGGGWRYRLHESGDVSQLGWQLMALKSAELAGVGTPERTWQLASRFLESVSSGTQGGLASYRPLERASPSMTAEALVCRVFLGLAPNSPAAREAGDYLLAHLPGNGEDNLYYWYYGTMAMYQLQGSHWQQWAAALNPLLVARQRSDGAMAGSWDPATRWDNYGGRVYSTAMATLCLEAYYRFLPAQQSSESSAYRPGPAILR